MHRLLILIVITFCFVGGLAAPAFATDYCPPVSAESGQVCRCTVRNYSVYADTLVVIKLYLPGGVSKTCGPFTVGMESGIANEHYCQEMAGPVNGSCGCRVTGEASYIRTSLEVGTGFSDFTPIVTVPCN